MLNSVYERRRANLAARLREVGAKQALTLKLDMTAPQISHWLRDPSKYGARKITEDSARDIERVLGLTPGELDHEQGLTAPKSATLAPAAAGAALLLLRTVVQSVLREVGPIKGLPMADKVADAIVLAFVHAVDHGAVDEDYVRSLVRLIQ